MPVSVTGVDQNHNLIKVLSSALSARHQTVLLPGSVIHADVLLNRRQGYHGKVQEVWLEQLLKEVTFMTQWVDWKVQLGCQFLFLRLQQKQQIKVKIVIVTWLRVSKFRGSITKINQSDCAIVSPVFSKYWTSHCPKWSCKITLTWRFLGSFTLYNESLINQACLVQYMENIALIFAALSPYCHDLQANILPVASLCFVNTCKIHLSASNLAKMVLFKMLMVLYGTYYLNTNK